MTLLCSAPELGSAEQKVKAGDGSELGPMHKSQLLAYCLTLQTQAPYTLRVPPQA